MVSVKSKKMKNGTKSRGTKTKWTLTSNNSYTKTLCYCTLWNLNSFQPIPIQEEWDDIAA